MQTYSEEEAARILKISAHKLAKMRRSGVGPRWANVGMGDERPRPVYQEEDLREWLRHRTGDQEGAE